jgi:phage terminase large subunit-like protein
MIESNVAMPGVSKALEAQLCGMIEDGGYAGPGRSPDRADAMVWALTELMLGVEKAGPRIRVL